MAGEGSAQLLDAWVGAAGNEERGHSEILRCRGKGAAQRRKSGCEISCRRARSRQADGLLSAPLMLKSTKLPAGTGTLPDAEQDAPFATEEQASVVSAMLAGVAADAQGHADGAVLLARKR